MPAKVRGPLSLPTAMIVRQPLVIMPQPPDITKIKERLYLGQVSDVARHAAENHTGEAITIINANARHVVDPLGSVQYSESKVLLKIIVVGSKSISGELKYEFAQVDDTYTELHIPVIKIEHKTTTNGSNIYNVFVQDNKDAPIAQIFNFVSKIIHDNVQANIPVYVVCQAGQSRSPSLLAAYLLKYSLSDLEYRAESIFTDTNGIIIGYQSPIHYLMQKRKMIQPNPGFQQQLMDYAEQVLKIDSLFDCLTSYSHLCSAIYAPAKLTPDSLARAGEIARKSPINSPQAFG